MRRGPGGRDSRGPAPATNNNAKEDSVKTLKIAVGWIAVLVMSLAITGIARADEGMWTFDNPPVKKLQERYGFTPTKEWLDHVRLASVRFNNGGSGSFISPEGLVLTNHHVARGQLQKMSSPEKNYVKDGFLAASRDQEIKCADLELNVLMSMENVTKRVQGVVKEGMSDKEALDAKKAEIARIEKESMDATGLRSDVVTLYHGGEYWLYRYKKYTDVRLVFAPEVGAAFFGGDPDNFTYPRYDLDMAIFRVYANGKPIKSPAYLKVNPAGAEPGDLVFVSGNPGSTDRLYTMAQLEMARDHSYPLRLAYIDRMLKAFQEYAKRGPEEARQADMMIFGLLNAKKALTGEYKGLETPHIWAKKQHEEQEFRELVAANPELQAKYGSAWDEIASAEKTLLSRFDAFAYRRMPGFRLPRMALQIVRYIQETAKPDGERLDGYHDSQLASLRFRLLSPAPVYPEMEQFLLADQLRYISGKLGPKDELIEAALGGATPQEKARELIDGTKLADPAFRKKLLEGGPKALQSCTDPLIVWARTLEPILHAMHDWYQDNVESVTSAAGEKLGAARFAVYGKSAYPDATFTLRLSYGAVKGYPMNGTKAPPFTTLFGLYDRAYSFSLKPPFLPPKRFLENRDKLVLPTRVNFVSTCDIIGGNSGSPVIDRKGELVGLIFDGNIESLVGRFVYDEETNRAVAVHPAYMIEAMRKLYGAGSLVQEILGS
ncbi:MAG: S46 family peptidase [Acidobacteria bacterium]|nr:S46 family peptidase [Acidobacteriota bacterium]